MRRDRRGTFLLRPDRASGNDPQRVTSSMKCPVSASERADPVPIPRQFYFNGHNWLTWKLRAAGISFEMRDNAFAKISDWRKRAKESGPASRGERQDPVAGRRRTSCSDLRPLFG